MENEWLLGEKEARKYLREHDPQWARHDPTALINLRNGARLEAKKLVLMLCWDC